MSDGTGLRSVFLGVDVGTGSARCGAFSATGEMLASASHPISLWQEGVKAEQSSQDIWQAVVEACRKTLAEAGAAAAAGQVKAISFDATCSLVVEGGGLERDTVVWMDHRAEAEALEVTETAHERLRYVGGKMSPEMQTPKLMWLKRHSPDVYARATRFFDLPDWLTFRATGNDSRSLCSTTCKWAYADDSWSASYFEQLGLADLQERDWFRIGQKILPLGEEVGKLSEAAANELGLSTSVSVAVSAIDAHAGATGLLGMGDSVDFNTRLCLIAGTSVCTMSVASEARFIPGVWGPYLSAVVPGLWLAEGGQSAAGALLDHVTRGGPGYEALNKEADFEATRDLHVCPDYNGNRSPLADAEMRGAIVGLSMIEAPLAVTYLAHVQALAFGVRHLVETLNEAGYDIQQLLVTGGLQRNELYLQVHADVCQLPIVLAEQEEAVLLGSAMMAATCCGAFESLPAAMSAMSRAGRTIRARTTHKDLLDRKYRVFRAMLDDQQKYRALMNDF